MAFQAPKMAPKMAPQTPRMALIAPIIALPQTDKPNFEGAAVIPEGIVNKSAAVGRAHLTSVSESSSPAGGQAYPLIHEETEKRLNSF